MNAKDNLYDQLVENSKMDFYPMHMPGHKRNTELMQMINPYEIDITEIEGFDNLHQPEGILLELSLRLTNLYGAKKSYPLVNGSTCGILSGISALTKYGDRVIVARNCHKSVYHAIELRGLHPVYYYPPKVEEMSVNGGILPRDIEELLIKHKDIKLVIITSPTYEGIVSDIKEIANIVHAHGAYLLVDEAHGAHFGFHKHFPKSAVQLGADVVIQSLHKTLPSLTQTAVLHSNVDQLNARIQKYLTIYQSSSPSYLLMAGIERCLYILEQNREELFENYYYELERFYQTMSQLKHLRILKRELIGQNGVFDVDPSKITISVRDTNMTGHQLQSILYNRYHIVMEMKTPEYILAMTSIGDKPEGFIRLSEALISIDEHLLIEKPVIESNAETIKPECMMPMSEAMEARSGFIPLQDSMGRICASFICMYPPGSPILVPGERIDKKTVEYIQSIIQNNINITGLGKNNEIEVLHKDRE